MRHHLHALALAAAVGCGIESPIGLTEPIRIAGGSFKDGALPGTSVPTGPATAPDPNAGVTVTALELANNLVRRGQVGRVIGGRLSPDAYSVGIRFKEAGTGYWVSKVEGPDPTANGEQAFRLEADFGYDVTPGLRTLQLVGFDGSGRAGQQREAAVCVLPDFPDNLNACEPTLEPPALVVGLEWGADMDLDLSIKTPDGKLVTTKRPSTAQVVGTEVPAASLADKTVGKFGPDSNANCHIDGARREWVVWQKPPPSGVYLVYANVFSACGERAARLRVTVHESKAGETAGTWTTSVTQSREGQLLGVSANGGAKGGLYVLAVTVP